MYNIWHDRHNRLKIVQINVGDESINYIRIIFFMQYMYDVSHHIYMLSWSIKFP